MPPPIKTASGRASPASACRRAALHDLKFRHAERRGVAGRPAGAIAARLDADRAQRRMLQQPLDRDRARAKPDIPEQLTVQRLQRRKRHRTNFPLRQLAVMLEQIVVKAGRKGMMAASGSATTSIAIVLSGWMSSISKFEAVA